MQCGPAGYKAIQLGGGEYIMAKKTKHTYHVSKTSLLIGVLGVLVGVLSILFVNQQSSARNDNASENGKELTMKSCDVKGDPIINVTQKILNDADSGQAGNYWGFDTIERKIQVWQVSDNKYCATVQYEGRFVGIAGQRSPGNTGVLTGSEKGEFKGGYRADITGQLLASPSLPMHGSLGTTDYRCDMLGNCPGAFSWTDKYFNTSAAGFTFSQPWWGWTYKNGDKVWVNASTGNSGDIL